MKRPNQSNKPNILVITHPFSNLVGEVMLTNFIDILAPLSGNIFIITGDFTYTSDRNIYIMKMRGDEKRESMLKRIPKFILTQLRISFNLIKVSRNTDVIIFSIGAKAFLIPMLLAKSLRKKTLVCTTGLSIRAGEEMYKDRLFGTGKFILPRIWEALERINYSLSDHIAVQSPSIVAYLGLDRYNKKISIASGRYVDTGLFDLSIDPKYRENLIGYIGRLSEEKGVMNFTEAISIVLKKHKEVKFLIGGLGPLFEKIEYQLKRYHLGERVRLLGWIPHRELGRYLNELKVLVLPSYSEGFPGIVREAMACGTAVVAVPVGGVPDLIKDGETGFILEDNSPECIAGGINRALNSPALDLITNNARALISQEHSYEAAVQGYREIFRKLTNR
ncbi:glycosyltransferase family 4 protein [Chloroflexota bacterium]